MSQFFEIIMVLDCFPQIPIVFLREKKKIFCKRKLQSKYVVFALSQSSMKIVKSYVIIFSFIILKMYISHKKSIENDSKGVIHKQCIRRHQIFLGGPRTKMKKSSENFWCASGAQKKGFPNFSPVAGFFRRGGTENC